MRAFYRDGDRTREVEVTPQAGGSYRVAVDGQELPIHVQPLDGGRLRLETPEGVHMAEVTPAGTRRFVRLGTLDFVLEREAGARRGGRGGHGAGLEAPMPGVVTRVMVSVGDAVTRGQPLVALEAMKMEHVIRAPYQGKVRSIAVKAGEMVAGGVAVAEVEEEG